MADIIGRKFEIQKMNSLRETDTAQFWAFYGRHRIGKTFLVRRFFAEKDCLFCEVTGQKGQKLERQVAHFQSSIEKIFFDGQRLPKFKNWTDAFESLLVGLQLQAKKDPNKECVVFLDELPWLATQKSGLLDAIDHAWNTQLHNFPNFRLIICGSAASWIIEKVIYSKGGLHNRLTATFRLLPFSLSETKEYLKKVKHSPLNESQILELYMCMGGVPFYLSFVKSEFTASQNIGNLFFGKGELWDEFDKLFAPLFENHETHEKIVKALVSSPQGLIREEIVSKAKVPEGRTATVALKELEEAGFIGKFVPINRTSREVIYRVTDEFCIFHFKWIAGGAANHLLNNGADHWMLQVQSQEFVSWSGLAFESICFKHVRQITKKLGFSSVALKAGPWSHRIIKSENAKNQSGAQIDLLFERADKVTTIAEIKYHRNKFELTKKEKENIENKIACYTERSKNKNYVNVAIVAPHGLLVNKHSEGFVTGVVTLADLFDC